MPRKHGSATSPQASDPERGEGWDGHQETAYSACEMAVYAEHSSCWRCEQNQLTPRYEIPVDRDGGRRVKVGLLRDDLMAEDALRRGEDYLRLTIDAIPVLAWCTRPDGWNEFLNQRWLDYTGLTIEEAQGWGWKVAIHPDDLPQLLDVWQGLLVSGKSGELEARLRRADGVYRWFLFRVEPLRDPQGTILKWYGTNTDIDDRKRAEALLAAENQILEMVATGRPLALILDGLCRLVDKLCDKSLASISRPFAG